MKFMHQLAHVHQAHSNQQQQGQQPQQLSGTPQQSGQAQSQQGGPQQQQGPQGQQTGPPQQQHQQTQTQQTQTPHHMALGLTGLGGNGHSSSGSGGPVIGGTSVLGGYECDVCHRLFRQRDRLREHGRIHGTGETPYTCGVCERGFTSQDACRCHMQSHPPQSSDPSDGGGLLQPPPGHVCTTCDKVMASAGRTPITHIRHGNTITPRRQGDRPFSCKLCGTTYASAGDLRRHVESHPGERPLLCPVCWKTFKSRLGLENHARLHTGERPFACPFAACGRAFAQRAALDYHAKTHTGENHRTCERCGKHFKSGPGYANHMRLHTPCGPDGTESYLKSASSRKSHLPTSSPPPIPLPLGSDGKLLHNLLKTCEECGKNFKSGPGYENHMRLHALRRTYGPEFYLKTCERCGKHFKSGPGYANHMRLHTLRGTNGPNGEIHQGHQSHHHGNHRPPLPTGGGSTPGGPNSTNNGSGTNNSSGGSGSASGGSSGGSGGGTRLGTPGPL
ncbi:hypothetical protein J437_LFUL007140 [Ladona fulva]|uniref:C2H2-type domain-containing protein n=1 Tax=Ladona fulva TaxID=123851 RepID=A0A8K0K7V1_LADFU|nr:hypothetical protein J437_LFUL007140 [Ladona fulva]